MMAEMCVYNRSVWSLLLLCCFLCQDVCVWAVGNTERKSIPYAHPAYISTQLYMLSCLAT